MFGFWYSYFFVDELITKLFVVMKKYEKASKKIHQQTQKTPGDEHKMDPKPVYIRDDYKGSSKLLDKIALITGGDSGIDRAVAVHFAREGANVSIVYLNEDKDAKETQELVKKEGRECLLIKGDIRSRKFCPKAVQKTVKHFGKLNILVNHAGEQHPTEKIEKLDLDLVEKTYQTNIFAMY